MPQSRRARRSARTSHLAEARQAGLAAALGLHVSVEPLGDGRDHGTTCRHCGAEGRIDMVDTTVPRAFLTCEACGRSWDTGRLDGVVVDERLTVRRS